MEMVSNLPPESRTIALADVAQRTKLPMDGVEFLLMKVGGCSSRRRACSAAARAHA